MHGNFSNRTRDVIAYSREEALRLAHHHIGTEHLLLGILREGKGHAVKTLRDLGCDLPLLKKTIEDKVAGIAGRTGVDTIPMTKKAEKVLTVAHLEAQRANADIIGTEHLLLSILHTGDNMAARILQGDFAITYDAVRGALGFEPVDLDDTGIVHTPPSARARAAVRATEPFSAVRPSPRPLPPPLVREIEPSAHKIPVTLAGLNAAPAGGGVYAMHLEETDGNRRVMIIIGAVEAQAIAMEREGIRPPRPMTHDLLQAYAERFGLTLVEVCIDAVIEGTFCSYLLVSSGDEETCIDARPSDAVALAVRAHAPLYVDVGVLEAAGVPDERPEDSDGEA